MSPRRKRVLLIVVGVACLSALLYGSLAPKKATASDATPQATTAASESPAEGESALNSGASDLLKSTGAYEFAQGVADMARSESDRVTQGDAEATVVPLGLARLIMIGIGLLLIYLAAAKGFEPMLLVPIGFAGILANVPVANMVGPEGMLGLIYHYGIETGLLPLFIFLGIGAMTDFGPLIANPKMSLLGAAAQIGIFATVLIALGLSDITGGVFDFSLREAASMGIIGGADGPTAIIVSARFAPDLMGAIAVAAYSYMALVPIIQPPIMRLLTTEAERKVRMGLNMRKVSKVEKIMFPLVVLTLCILIVPEAAPLIGALMFGNLVREIGVVDRLSKTLQNDFANTVTILLGLAVGSKLAAEHFLVTETLGILVLGAVAFALGTAGGVLLAKLMAKVTREPLNPLIGAAGVSACPMSARVVNVMGLKADKQNFLLFHAMGANVSGQIGSVVAAGVILAMVR